MSTTATTAITIAQADQVTATQKIDTNYKRNEFEWSVDKPNEIITGCSFDLNSEQQTLTLSFGKNTTANDRSDTFKVKSTLSSNYGEELCKIYFTQKGTGPTPTNYLWIDDNGRTTASETISSAGGSRQHTILTNYNFSALRASTPDSSWIKDVKLTQEGNTIKLSYDIDANTGTGAVRRSGRVSVYGGGTSQEVYVGIDQQAGTHSNFSFRNQTSNVDADDQRATNEFTNHFIDSVTITFDGEGITSTDPATANTGTGSITAHFSKNTDQDKTKTRIVYAKKDGVTLDTWTITQNAAKRFSWKNDETSEVISGEHIIFDISSGTTSSICTATSEYESVNFECTQGCSVSPATLTQTGDTVVRAQFPANTGSGIQTICISAYTGETPFTKRVVGTWTMHQDGSGLPDHSFNWTDTGVIHGNEWTLFILGDSQNDVEQNYSVIGYDPNQLVFTADTGDIITSEISNQVDFLQHGTGHIMFDIDENPSAEQGRVQDIIVKDNNQVIGKLTINQGPKIGPVPVEEIFSWYDGTSQGQYITTTTAASATSLTATAASSYDLVKFTADGQNCTVTPSEISGGSLGHRITATFNANESPRIGKTITISAYTGVSITEQSILGVWTIEQGPAGLGPIIDDGDLIDDGGLVIDDPDNPTPGDDNEPIIDDPEPVIDDDPDPTPGDGPELSQNE